MVESILVRSPNWVGDQVLAYPFFYYLRKAYPRAKITSVCVPWVSSLQYRDLVDDVEIIQHRKGLSFFERFQLITQMGNELRRKSGGFDLAFSLPNSFSAAWLLYRSGARQRRGYRADLRGFLLNQPIEWDANPNRHRAQAYLDLLPKEFLPDFPVKQFWRGEDETEREPELISETHQSGELDSFDASSSWSTADAIRPPSDHYWVLAPGATAESRRWSVGGFAKLARLIHGATGWKGVVVGGPGEKRIAERLCEDEENHLLNYVAQGAVADLWKIFKASRVTVCNESGLAHVAALCGSPVHIVCGAADPRRTEPLGPGRVRVTFNDVDCWPCEKNICLEEGDRKLQCLRGIQPERVWEEIQSES